MDPDEDEDHPNQWRLFAAEVIYKVPAGEFPDVAVLQWNDVPPVPAAGRHKNKYSSSPAPLVQDSAQTHIHAAPLLSAGWAPRPLEWCKWPDAWPGDGDQVLALGFPLFAPTGNPHPIACSGVMTTKPNPNVSPSSEQHARVLATVAAAASTRLRPAVVLTSAPVHPGNSGGPVICASTGSLVGIITSYLQCMDESGELMSSFPRLNFVVPMPALEPLRLWLAAVDSGSKLVNPQDLRKVFAAVDQSAMAYWLPAGAAAGAMEKGLAKSKL
jgi:hypothetical protein